MALMMPLQLPLVREVEKSPQTPETRSPSCGSSGVRSLQISQGSLAAPFRMERLRMPAPRGTPRQPRHLRASRRNLWPATPSPSPRREDIEDLSAHAARYTENISFMMVPLCNEMVAPMNRTRMNANAQALQRP